jgi:Ca2+-binding RTX toxin-like protein
MTRLVSNSTELRAAIQAAKGTDFTAGALGDPIIELIGTGSFSSAITLGKRSSTNPAPFAYTGYTVQGAGSSADTSAVLEDTRIFQQNIDSAFSPGTVQNLRLNYSSSSNGNALLSVTSTAARTLTIKNVNFTGTTTGWSSNGNLYMSLRSFSNTSPLNTTFTLDNVKVEITGQNNGFTASPTSGGSAFFHNWNNAGVVTIKDSVFDEGGFRSSFNFNNFGTLTTTPPNTPPNNIISGNTFKRTTNANVRDEGNRLQNVTATLSSNTFSDGSFIDLHGNISGITFNSNTFNTIADGYGIRVTSPNTGSPTFSGTNTFTGPGLAIRYINSTPSTSSPVANNFLNYGSTPNSPTAFSVGGRSYERLIAFGQGADNYNLFTTLGAQNAWISADNGNDTITAGSGNDYLFGGAGNDNLSGNAGADIIDGGIGDDRLLGGTGVDTLTGGLGADTFRWSNSGDHDLVTDFNASLGDKIGITPNTFQSFASITSGSATVLNNRITLLTNSNVLGTAGSVGPPVVAPSGIMGLTVNPTGTTAQTGFVMYFDSILNRGLLVYDQNWRDTTGRQVCFTFDTLQTLASVSSLTAAQFVAL